MPEAVRRPLPPSVFARLAEATRYAISGVSPDGWFGPQQPLAPFAPPEVKGRQFDYPFGANLNYVPRADYCNFVRPIARARRRAAASARGDRNPQGPDRRPELRSARAGARRRAGRIEKHRRGDELSRPPRSAPFLRRLAAHAGRGHAGHRRRHHLSPLYARRLALFARHHRRSDHQAADRRGRPRAGAARPRLSAGAARRAGGRLLGRRTPLSAAQRARRNGSTA